nr:MAG TPA: hypothetical protein [Caudoviricetes sp.]
MGKPLLGRALQHRGRVHVGGAPHRGEPVPAPGGPLAAPQ